MWAKMAGYITGRVILQDVFSKIQSSAKSQGEKVVDTTKKGVIAETVSHSLTCLPMMPMLVMRPITAHTSTHSFTPHFSHSC